MPPEVLSGKPYDPFKLDVWQLGKSISDFKVPSMASVTFTLLTVSVRFVSQSTIPEIDKVLASMVDPDPTTRPTAYEAMKSLLNAIGAIPPVALIIEPEVEPLKFATL